MYLAKPHLASVKQRKHLFKKGMQLNCSIEKVNPRPDSFVWQYCDPKQSTCDRQNDTLWEQTRANYLITKVENLTISLVLEDQPQENLFYRCKAENIVGTDHIDFEVAKTLGNV